MVAVVCLVGYAVADFTGTAWVSVGLGIVLMIVDILNLNKSKYGAVEA